MAFRLSQFDCCAKCFYLDQRLEVSSAAWCNDSRGKTATNNEDDARRCRSAGASLTDRAPQSRSVLSLRRPTVLRESWRFGIHSSSFLPHSTPKRASDVGRGRHRDRPAGSRLLRDSLQHLRLARKSAGHPCAARRCDHVQRASRRTIDTRREAIMPTSMRAAAGNLLNAGDLRRPPDHVRARGVSRRSADRIVDLSTSC
jgi:hypothetical protein